MIVIGAGIAGLTAANRLRACGINVVVLEASSNVGGRMSTACDGLMFERGAQVLSSRYSTLMPLIHELGLSSALRTLPEWHAIAHGERIARLSANNPVVSWQSGLVSTKSWLQLAWWVLRRSDIWSHHPSTYSSWQGSDDRAALDWSQEHLGQEVTERLLEPSLQAFYFHDLTGSSRALALAQLAYLTRPGTLYTLADGLQSLPDALAARLDVRTNVLVHSVSANSESVTVHTDSETYLGTWAIMSVPADIAGRLYASSDPLERELMNVPYSSTIVVGVELGVGAQVPSPAFYGLGFSRQQEPLLAGIGVDAHKRFRAPATDFTLTLRGEAAASLWDLGDAQLAARMVERASRYVPALSNHVHSVRVARWPHASPQSPVGRSRNIAAYRLAWQPERRVLLAGDYMGTPCADGAAETGAWAASRLLTATGHPRTR